MAEQKPNYAHWDQEQEFTVHAAACLLCDIEPRSSTRDNRLPLAVSEMAKQVAREGVQITDTSRTVMVQNWALQKHVPKHVPGERYVTRADLLAWCERTGRKHPFLHPEERDRPPAEWGFTHDTELLRIARQVIKEHWEGKDPKKAPSKEWIIDRLKEQGLSKNEAEAVDLITRHDSRRHKTR